MGAGYTALAVAVFATILALVVWAIVRVHRSRPQTGAESLIGEEGEAATDINPKGQVFVHGEYWRARSKQPIAKGEEIRVVGHRGLVLFVERIEKGVGDGRDTA